MHDQDYEAIANAFINRFRQFQKNTDNRKDFYPEGEEPLDDLVQAIQFMELSRDAIPANHPIYDDLIKMNNNIIRSLKGEVDAYKSAQEAHQGVIDGLSNLIGQLEEQEEKKIKNVKDELDNVNKVLKIMQDAVNYTGKAEHITKLTERSEYIRKHISKLRKAIEQVRNEAGLLGGSG